MLDTHRVSLTSLDAMAEGRSDPAIVDELKQANRSRQLTLLRAVLDRGGALASSLTPLPPLERAWKLLADAQARDASAVEVIITHPQTGLWAAKVVRRLGTAEAADDPVPLWADLGHLHLLATVAAIRAGHDFRSRVPVWRGSVMLPTLGLADLQGRREWDFADVHGEGGHVLVRGPAGSVRLPDDRAAHGIGWLPLRTLDADEKAVWLDDLDPYREFEEPLAPRRLPADEVTRWADGLRATWQLLTRHHPATAAELGAGLDTLVPRAPIDRHSPFNASHNDAFGQVVLSLPKDPTVFAATLIHELQHSKLGVLLTLVDLLDPNGDNDTPRLYAPWRDDPRPATGILHGVFSFLGVTAFYHEHHVAEVAGSGLPARAAQFEFAYRREQTAHAAGILLTEAAPSPLGRRFLATARERLRAWSAEPLPGEVLATATRANLDHRLLWRLRNLEPPAALVAELTQAWLSHRPNPVVRPTPSLLTPSNGSPMHPRLVLARTRLIEPDLYDDYRAEPDLAMAQITDATAADLALTDGDVRAAADLYHRQITARPDSAYAWAGLALATGDQVLLDRPELVYAVHREIRVRSGVATNPAHLAQWLR